MSTEDPEVQQDELLNNLVAAGAVMGCLHMTQGKTALTRVEPVYNGTVVTNQIKVYFEFLKSPYLITVERIDEDDEPF